MFGYDRWATRRVLTVRDGLDPAVWYAQMDASTSRGQGRYRLVHHLGATRRGSHGCQGSHRRVTEPEDGRLPTIDQLRERREPVGGRAIEAWLPTQTDGSSHVRPRTDSHPRGRLLTYACDDVKHSRGRRRRGQAAGKGRARLPRRAVRRAELDLSDAEGNEADVATWMGRD